MEQLKLKNIKVVFFHFICSDIVCDRDVLIRIFTIDRCRQVHKTFYVYDQQSKQCPKQQYSAVRVSESSSSSTLKVGHLSYLLCIAHLGARVLPPGRLQPGQGIPPARGQGELEGAVPATPAPPPRDVQLPGGQ